MKTITKHLLKKAIQYIKKPVGLLPDKFKQEYNKVLGFLSITGLEKTGTPGLGTHLNRLSRLTDLEGRLSAARELVRQYPDHPLSQLELVKCIHSLNDPFEFEQMNRYGEIRSKWLRSTLYGELGLEFIWPGMVTGAFGNPYSIESLLWANKLGLRSASKLVLLLGQRQLRNPALFSYFEPHINVVRDAEAIHALKGLEFLLTLPLGLCLPMNDGCYFLDLSANRAEMEREKHGLDQPLFYLSDRHREMGEQALKNLGLHGDAWYVTLHVREPGYRGETRENTTENWRNANPLDYIKAIEAVTSAGGWVFRMGDPSMTPLPPMSKVVDYAHHEVRSDWMDVFLGATCRFLIGTGSGYYHIPSFFGVPRIMTNYPGFVDYYGMRKWDLYLPRWLKNVRKDELVSFEEYMSPPVSMLRNFRDAGLNWVENTPEELEAVTKEMLELTDSGHSSNMPDDDLQQRFKELAESCGLKHGGHPVKAFAPMSRDFLSQHADLLEIE